MTDSRSPWPTPPVVPDAEEWLAAWRRLSAAAVDMAFATSARAIRPQTPLAFDPTAPARAFADLGLALVKDPSALAAAQAKAVQEWAALFGAGPAGEASGVEPAKGDRRFSDPAWTDDPWFALVKKSYLLAARQMTELVAGAGGLDEKTRARIDFFVRQYLNALSPANFPATNPEALKKTVETGGLNLMGGLANLLSDLARPEQWVRRRASGDFVLGRDLAATPGGVVCENELMQLIEYAPATAKVRARPLLYVPPLVNKYYLLDLTPEASLLRWLVAEGFTVFAISWVNPGPEHQDFGFSDYVEEGPLAALDAIAKAAPGEKADVFAFCMGGAVAAAALARLSATGRADRAASLTLIGALMDYSELGEWSTFAERAQIEAFNEHIERAGLVAGEDLKKLFSVVRANDLIWNSVVDHYLMDRKAPASDLLHWFADGANMTKAFLKTWSRDILHANRLVQGEIAAAGGKVDLKAIGLPVLNIALKDDHVSGWEAVYANAKAFSGATEFLLGGSGHNAGVVNPPARGKHGYWTNPRPAESPAQWLAGATRHEGSWWPYWTSWLTSGPLAQGDVAARRPGDGLAVVEPAPGRYVLG